MLSRTFFLLVVPLSLTLSHPPTLHMDNGIFKSVHVSSLNQVGGVFAEGLP